MTLEINAQFNKFLRFAELQANPAKSEAIARVAAKGDALAGQDLLPDIAPPPGGE